MQEMLPARLTVVPPELRERDHQDSFTFTENSNLEAGKKGRQHFGGSCSVLGPFKKCPLTQSPLNQAGPLFGREATCTCHRMSGRGHLLPHWWHLDRG